MKKLVSAVLIAAAISVSGCSVASEPAWKKAVAGDGPGDLSLVQQSAVKVANLPKSRSGNRSEYEVFGVRYAVLDSAVGFREQGIASWYGKKFHGNATASGEIYDMHQLTAAHKHLPLPTFVKVTRIDNGQSIVVKVNDRGPFVGDRVIDLSYAAAASLDMLGSGKAHVQIEALSSHEHEQPGQSLLADKGKIRPFIQAGAFGDVGNAENFMQRISETVPLPVQLDFEAQQQVYRVQVGPLNRTGEIGETLELLASMGIEGYVVEKKLPQ